MKLQKPICNCSSHNIVAGAMMWLQESRFGFRIFIILCHRSFSPFCRDSNFLSNSPSFGAAFTWDFFCQQPNFIVLSPDCG